MKHGSSLDNTWRIGARTTDFWAVGALPMENFDVCIVMRGEDQEIRRHVLVDEPAQRFTACHAVA